jgi:hypothetical protein
MPLSLKFTCAWGTSLRLVRWLPILASIGVTCFFVISPERARAIEIAIPLMIGLHAAFAFAPEDESALELLCAAPRPLAYLLIERVGWLIVLHGAVALIATAILADLLPANALTLIARWLPPSALMLAFGVYAALIGRRSNVSALLVIGVTLALLIGADSLVARYPILTPIHPYLITNDPAAYALNRVVVSALALILFARTLWIVRHDERLLGIE